MRSFRLWIALIVSGTMAVAVPATAASTSYITGEILVKFKSGTPAEKVQQVLARTKTTVKRKPNFIGVRVLSLPPGLSVEEAVAFYQADPDVQYAEPNYVRRAFTPPNDHDFDQQWGLHNIGQTINTNPPFNGRSDTDIDAPEAWDVFQSEGRVPGVTPGGTPLIVAVIDSGMDYTHPDLKDNIWTNSAEVSGTPGVDDDENGFVDDVRGWDFASCATVSAQGDCITPKPRDNDPMDDNGHGTHVAGIIGARGNNAIGISGVNWDVSLMPLKILNANGDGVIADEVDAIGYAIQKGARIINASFGAPGLSLAEEDAIRAANNAGIVFVAAAGNESSDNDKLPIYPAGFNLPNVISVAASDPDDQLADFSNFGKNRVDIAAPGVCILSTISIPVASELSRSCPNPPTAGYDYLSGSSMATPFVSGAAGLLLSQDPSLTPEEVRAAILLTADPMAGLKGRVASSGRLNANNALRGIKGSGLIGGSGGCGFPIAMIRTDRRASAPPIQVLLFLLGMFWPLLIPVVRKIRREGRFLRIFLRRRIMAASVGLLALMVLWPPTAAALDEDPSFLPVHSLGLKLGYHRYNTSDYLDTNSGLLSRSDLAGLSGELEYDWRWREDGSLSVTAGRYHSRTDLKNVCCDTLSFSTNYLLLTPKHYSLIRPVEWYVGGGIGFYNFRREVHGLIDDRLSANTLGLHAVIGLNWPVFQRVSLFTEIRYALAKVKSADAFNDALDVGGLNYSIGASWRFPPTGLRP